MSEYHNQNQSSHMKDFQTVFVTPSYVEDIGVFFAYNLRWR